MGFEGIQEERRRADDTWRPNRLRRLWQAIQQDGSTGPQNAIASVVPVNISQDLNVKTLHQDLAVTGRSRQILPL